MRHTLTSLSLKSLSILCFAILLTNVPIASAIVQPSLGWWNEDAAGSTHALWQFTPGYVTPVAGGGGYSATPEEVFNPSPLNVVATISPGGTWDGQTQFVSGSYIAVNLELPNYITQNPLKEIWVDLGANVAVNLLDISVAATPTNVRFEYEIIRNQGPADFGIIIRPNPYVEKVGFVLFSQGTAPILLDYIHVDTICIPEPTSVALLAIGGLFLKRRIL